MILTKASKPTSRPYWLINDEFYGLHQGHSTIKECFERMEIESLFFVPGQYTITDTFIAIKTHSSGVDEIIATFSDCTYEEFCQQYPELLI